MRRAHPGLLGMVAAVCGVVVAGPAVANLARQKEDEKKPVVHVVLFRVKKDAAPKAAEELIRDVHRLLAKIPVVVDIHVGRRAPGEREVHLKDYDVGLYILFKKLEDVQTYLDHPLHVEFAERARETVENVRVMDFYSE
jgi:hypothetical protein